MENKNILLIVGGIILLILIVLLLKPSKKPANGTPYKEDGGSAPYFSLPTLDIKTNNFLSAWKPLQSVTTSVDTTTLATQSDIRALQQAINLSNQKAGSFRVLPVGESGTLDLNTINQLIKIDEERGQAIRAKNAITKREASFFIETINDDL